jgi:hypothetical protein
MVSRLMAELIAQGEIARRGRLYILLKGGTIAAIASGNVPAGTPPPTNYLERQRSASGRRRRAA